MHSCIGHDGSAFYLDRLKVAKVAELLKEATFKLNDLTFFFRDCFQLSEVDEFLTILSSINLSNITCPCRWQFSRLSLWSSSSKFMELASGFMPVLG